MDDNTNNTNDENIGAQMPQAEEVSQPTVTDMPQQSMDTTPVEDTSSMSTDGTPSKPSLLDKIMAFFKKAGSND